MEWIMEHWLSTGTAIFLTAMVLYGHYRGFLRLALNLACLVLSAVMVDILSPYVNTFIREKTEICQMLRLYVRDMAVNVQPDILDVQLPAQQRMIIEQFQLPEHVKEALLENNNNEIYRLLGVETFIEYVGTYLADMIINLISSVLLFIIIFIFVRIVIRWMDLVAKLPILSGLNQIAGALLGGLQGLLVLWCGCLIVSCCSGMSWANAVLTQIQTSVWLQIIYRNNILNLVFISILKNL